MVEEFLFRYLIEGDDVQGVNLRRKIAKKAKEGGIKGFARNLPNGKVEVLCKTTDNMAPIFNDKIDNLKDEIVKIEKVSHFKLGKTNLIISMFDDDFEDFEVKREDQLQEMVWALQGAGKQFAGLEKIRIKGLIRGLRAELNSIGLDSIKLGKGEINHDKKLSIFRLKNFLTSAPIDNEEIMDSLEDLYRNCEYINSLLSQPLSEEIDKLVANAAKPMPQAIETIAKSFSELKREKG